MSCYYQEIVASSAVVEAGALSLVSGSTVVPQNGRAYVLIITANIPASTTVTPVQVQFGGVDYPLLDRNGNTLYSDQLRFLRRTCSRNLITLMVYGNNVPHFTVQTRLPASIAAGIEVGR